MSRQFFLLLRVQMQNALRFSDIRKKTGKEKMRYLLMGGLYLFVAAMLLFYCYLLAAGLLAVGLARLIPLYAVTMGGLFTLFFTFLKANGMLFGCRDYELLTALPIPPAVVITSRFAVMYLFNLGLCVGVMAAMGAAYLPQTGSVLPWVFWIVGALWASLIPTTLATAAAALVAAASSRFKYSNAVTILLSVALVFGIFGLSAKIGAMDEEQLSVSTIAALGDQLAGLLTRIYPPAAWFGRAVIEGSLAAFCLFVGFSLGLYLLFAVVLAAFYQKIQNGLTAHGASGQYRVGRLAARSPLAALYQKEWKRFLSLPSYVLNMGIGALMTAAASAAVCFLGPEALGGLVNIPGIEDVFIRIPLYLPVILLPLCNTACVSLSLEGRQLWILQSSPVTLGQVFLSKILVNLTLTIPCAGISYLLLWVRLRPSLADGLMMLVLACSVALLTAVAGIWFNLKFPVYQWENPTQIIKQSASSMCGILSGMILGVGLTFLSVRFSAIPLWMMSGMQCAAILLLAGVLLASLARVKRL